MFRQKKYHFLMVMILAFWTIRCGKGGKSSDVILSISPGTPNVITVDYKLDETTTIKAPWYAFNINVANNSDETVTILSIQLNVRLANANGSTTPTSILISPSSANFDVACGGTVTQKIEYTDMGMYLPGESKAITLTFRGTLDPACPTINPITPLFYAGNNPNPSGTNPNYTYIVQMKAIGWFGTLTAPTERLDASSYFSTN